jgi:hypothetical protein
LTARKNRRAERHSFYELTGRGTACKLFIVVQRFIIDMQVHFNSLVCSSRQSDLSCCCPSIQ